MDDLTVERLHRPVVPHHRIMVSGRLEAMVLDDPYHSATYLLDSIHAPIQLIDGRCR